MAEQPIKSKYIIPNDNYMSKIKNMLISIIEHLNSNNIIKSTLVNLQDFNQKALFDELDTLQKGYINSIDIINFLKKFSLNFSEQLVRRFIQHYDKKTPYKLYFEDFNALITPKTIMNEENGNNKKENRDEIFLKVLKNEFKLIVKYHEMIVDIKKCENFITYEAFISISDEEKNITKEKLKKFLGEEYSEEDTKNLLYYLDMDNDGLLTYDEFEDFFASMPVSQDDINYMNNEEIKYAVKSKEKILKETNIKNEEIKNESNQNQQIIKKEKEENIRVKNNIMVQNKIIYEENINKITEVKTKEIKYDVKNINIKNINNNKINNDNNNDNNIDSENNKDNIDNRNNNLENDDIEEILNKNNNKIVKKINYNNKNLLKNNEEIIEYEESLKNRYSSTEENQENNNINYKNKNFEENNFNFDEKEENNLKKLNVNDDLVEKNRNQNKKIFCKNEVNKQENNINNKKQYKIEIKNNIINKEFHYYNSQNNDHNNNDNIKENNNIYENNQFSGSYKVIDKANNNKEIIENININNNKIINNNNNNESNNLLSSNNFSGNLSSTDFNKSDNFISENNNNNNLQKNNEIEYKIQNKNEYDIEYNNFENNINQKKKKKNININNKLDIETENLEYIQNKNKINISDDIQEEELYIQKNTNIEIKKEINSNEQEKNKILPRKEIKKDTNNLLKINIKNENINKIEANNNSINHNSNSDNSHANNINVNGSLFTCGGNIDHEKITLKPDVQEKENEDYKYNINSIQTNNDLVTQIKSGYKKESPFANINKNLNDVFSKEVYMNKNIKKDEFEIFKSNNNNKYFYFQDRMQKEEDGKINYNQKNKNENIYINKMDKEIKKNEIIKNINTNKAFKEQIHEERENYMGELSEIKYKYTNEKYIIENNNLKKNLQLTNNNNMNIFSNENISQKSEPSDNDEYIPNNEQTIHDLSHIIDINSNEYNFSSKTSINIFLDYIDNILKLESTCLILKESLALREDITFKELFCLFDYHKNKNISIHEFKKVCKNTLGLYPTTDQVTLIFNRYDINKDEKLDLKEFLNMISPIKKEYLSILFGDKKNQKPFRSDLSEKSKKIIENLTKAIILNETNYYEIKEKMRINNFNKNEVWNILNQFSKNKNYLNRKNFDRFLKAYSYYLTSYEIDIIFNKFDFDKDSHLNLSDFMHEFSF